MVDSADRDRIGISKDELIYMLRVSNTAVVANDLYYFLDKNFILILI